MIDLVKECFRSQDVLFSRHASYEMLHESFREIRTADVYDAVLNGDLIMRYPEDKPHPSCLIMGHNRNGRPIHTVCAYDDVGKKVIVITVYEPDPKMWISSRVRRVL